MTGSGVGPEDVRRLLDSEMPSLRIRTLRAFGAGWDNQLFLVNDDLIVRVAKTEIDAARLLTEARTLSSIAPRLPLPVPVPEFVHEASVDVPWAAMAYRLIDGDPLPAEVPECAIDRLAGDLAEFLNALHGLNAEIADEPGLPAYTADEWLQRQRELVDATSPALRAGLDEATVRRFHAWWGDYQSSQIAMEFAPCLVHGDLAREHVLIDPSTMRVRGVIDFGDAMVADPALDLAGLPDRLARAVVERLGGSGDREAVLVRRDAYRRISPLHAVRTGLERGDRGLFDEGLRGINGHFSE